MVPHPAPKNVGKNSSQNGLRMYPELLPHQLRAISTYPNPPLSHIGKDKKTDVFLFLREFLLHDPAPNAIESY